MQRLRAEPQLGRARWRSGLVCEIASLQLTPGEYRVDAAIVSGQVGILDKVEGAFRITVIEADYYGTGRVPQWGSRSQTTLAISERASTLLKV